MTLTDEKPHFRIIRSSLLEHLGIQVPIEKNYFLEDRTKQLLRSRGISIDTFVESLRDPARANDLLSIFFTVNETSFFRDIHPFQCLEEHLLTQVAGARNRRMVGSENPSRLEYSGIIRMWSAATSIGKEAYSLAMSVNRWKRRFPQEAPWKVSVMATDISEENLNWARRGIYSPEEVNREVPQEDIPHFFTPVKEGMSVAREIRNMITFQPLNLMGSFSNLGFFDMIFCRNVLIYFKPDLRDQVIRKIIASLLPGGILVLGSSETLMTQYPGITPVRLGKTLVYRKG